MVDTQEYIELTEAVSKEIANLEAVKSYKGFQKKIMSDPAIGELIRVFERARDEYEDIQRFGEYYPQKDQVRLRLVHAKSALFENPQVAGFKKCEKEIHSILEQVSRVLNEAVEFETGNTTGGCCSGSSCSCSSKTRKR